MKGISSNFWKKIKCVKTKFVMSIFGPLPRKMRRIQMSWRHHKLTTFQLICFFVCDILFLIHSTQKQRRWKKKTCTKLLLCFFFSLSLKKGNIMARYVPFLSPIRLLVNLHKGLSSSKDFPHFYYFSCSFYCIFSHHHHHFFFIFWVCHSHIFSSDFQ